MFSEPLLVSGLQPGMMDPGGLSHTTAVGGLLESETSVSFSMEMLIVSCTVCCWSGGQLALLPSELAAPGFCELCFSICHHLFHETD